MKRWCVVLLLAACVSPAAFAEKTATADHEGVRQAALDYVEGIYLVQPDRITRSVHPTVVKRGFYRADPATP